MTPDMSLSELSPLTPWVQACALCLGCIIGSFLNVVEAADDEIGRAHV